MRSLFSFWALFAVAALCCCQKAPELIMTGPSTLSFEAKGGDLSIAFTANRTWKVSAADSWVRISPAEGSPSDGEISVSIHCDRNEDFDDRSTTVTIRMEELTKTVQVTQSARLEMAVPMGLTGVDIPPEGQTFEVEVQANVPYTVSIAPGCTWIQEVGSRALPVHHHTFQVLKNGTRSSRSAQIEFRNDQDSFCSAVTVRQACRTILQAKDTLLASGRGWTVQFRTAGSSPEDYRLSCESDWLVPAGQEASPEGAFFSVKAEPLPDGAPGRLSRVFVFDKDYSDPDTLFVRQFAAFPAVSYSFSAKTGYGPGLGGDAPKAFVLWGDGAGDFWQEGLTHTYSASGPHTVTVEKVQGNSVTIGHLEDGMTISFKEVRK